MKTILIFIFILASLFANKAVTNDILGGNGTKKIKLKNGDANGKNELTKVSLWCEINSINVKQFAIVNSTILTKGNVNGDIILNDITYDGRNPSYAKITSNKLIFVFDTNDTAKNGSLVIGAGILRDGFAGGALNDGINIDNDNIIDKASPVIALYETVDSSRPNGYIDQIKLTFSENIIRAGDINKSLTIGSSYKNQTDATTSGNVLIIPLTEKKVYDTGIAPTISYNHTNKKESNLTDAAKNLVPTFSLTTSSTVKIRDTVKPLLVSFYGTSINAAGDQIHLGFSEKIKNNLKAGRITISNSAPNKLDNATFSTGEINITITLNEAIDGQFATDRIKITVEANITDKADNNITKVTKEITSIIEEPTAPKLVSISRVGDEDKLKITFNEPMKTDTVDNASDYIITNIKAPATPSITGAIQSNDKKSVILSIGNFPKFSSSEKDRSINIQAKNTVADFVGNVISTTDNNKTYIILKDIVAPLAQNFKINMKTGKIDISFDEKIAVSGFAPTKIDINISTTKKITLTLKSTAVYSGNDVNISLNEDLDMVKHFLGTNEDINLTIRASSGIIDFASVGFKSGNVSLATNGFTADDIPPKLLSWDYDLDKKKFTLLFNEDMNVSSNYNATKIKIGDSNASTTHDLTLLANKSSAKTTSTYGKVEINILSSQVSSILQASLNNLNNLDINSSQTFIKFASGSGITDSAGNQINPSIMPPATKSTWKSKYNAISNLKVIPNKWNHISVEHNTTSNDILSTGKVSYIYGHDGTKWVDFPTTLSSHKGYWIKTSNSAGTNFNVPAIKNIKGSKNDDLARIRSKTDGKFHLIGIEHALRYEEIQAVTPSGCKSMRIHHYVSDTTASNEGWDVNESISANDALWVLCIK